ncbi:hypothetical protein AAF712_011128 [Marasmius tenuissimus]|uniref:Cytochrome P450 n=1 Tax=Marasmius tenuissimus TaxID=585030 RepID=A0ABR2ZL64_9AGAR
MLAFASYSPPLLLFVFTVVVVTSGIFLIPLFLFTVTSLKAHREHSILPDTLPFVGKQSGQLLSSFRANVRGATQSARLFAEAYTKCSLNQIVSIVPTWTKGPQVLVPPSLIPWLSQQPAHTMNAKDCTFENMQFAYTVQHPEITHNDLLDLMIKRDLTKSVGNLNDEIVQEIQECMEELFGGDVEGGGEAEWREVGVWDSMIKLVARSANRVFVGPELCKNDEYLMSCVRWTRDIQVSGAIMHMIPKFLKPYVARLATIPNRRDTATNLKHSLPLVEQRIADMTRKLNDKTFDYEAPDELLTWMIQESFKRSTESERSAYSLAYRLLLLNFAAVSTSTIGGANAVLDVLATDPSDEVLITLREEAERVLAEHGGVWTKAAVNKLHRMDSTLRESARFSGVGGTGLARRVRSEEGVLLPIDGQDGKKVWVPKGATVGVAQAGIHFDERYYGENASKFDAFRFSRPKEDGSATTNEDLVTTSPNFLAFSHGVHACPGRFFAANQLKLIMANLVLNYDVQPLPSRPANTPLGDVMIPPIRATMKIKRRKRDTI